MFLGIDVGTSGVRAAVIDASETLLASTEHALPPPDEAPGFPTQRPAVWWSAVSECLDSLAVSMKLFGSDLSDIEAIAVDGTSGTICLADEDLNPVTSAYMYNASGFQSEADSISQFAEPNSLALGSGSTLARLLRLQRSPEARGARFALHQADWIAAKLTGIGGRSDENNALKLGYDLFQNCWPSWFESLGVKMELLPEVRAVGDPLGNVAATCVARFGLSRDALVAIGTTDGNASFLGSGASSAGEAVTSLGTTLTVKLLSEKPVVDPSRGVYSHRLFGMWLAGGASNTGGGALLQFFSPERMAELELQLDPEKLTGTDFYPLPRIGERFPVADPNYAPRHSPRSKNDAEFFQGLLEGIARIERDGYRALESLGATEVSSIRTSGGGASNRAWMRIRKRIIGRDISASSSSAAEGSAKVALKCWTDRR
ncbi:MAG: FGGY-family carbohydrate kinase [Albidovulum sp.]|nr:FGGY-family carbohydrate kinase [Albidovulum sp.]